MSEISNEESTRPSEAFMRQEDVLIEALPYIQQFRGKTMVIKLGGHAMVDACVMETTIKDIVLLHMLGIRVVVVHGGGPEITDKMKALGKEPRFVGGLRITDSDTLEVAQMVLVGKISTKIVSLISKQGAKGVGISGNDANLIIAQRMNSRIVEIEGKKEEVDLGYVGDIVQVNPGVLDVLLDSDIIPVVSPLAIDTCGNDLNINADTAAGSIAAAMNAFKLISMTDVDGIMNEERTKVYQRVSVDEAWTLFDDGTIREGMIPKVKAVLDAIGMGVRHGHIINGNRHHNLLLELFTASGVGTMIVAPQRNHDGNDDGVLPLYRSV
jgi:acetylglutamate kinase